MPPRVSIIILNWNGLSYTLGCLESLKKITYADYEVIVVDNGSEGDDVRALKDKYEGYIHIIENDRNYGFAKGNNIGIKYAVENFDPQYLMLLNNDTIVDPEFLTELIRVAESDDRIGSCQSKILSLEDPRTIDAVGLWFCKGIIPVQIGYGKRDEGQYDHICEVFGACACSALYRREMFDQVGLFDEDFFAYIEDVDLAWRARLFGWKCLYIPTSLVYHSHSATGASIKQYFISRNITFYMFKNAPLDMVFLHMRAMMWIIPMTMVSIPMTILKALKHRDHRHLEDLRPMFIGWKAQIAAFYSIPRMLKKRRKLQSARLVSDSEINRWLG